MSHLLCISIVNEVVHFFTLLTTLGNLTFSVSFLDLDFYYCFFSYNFSVETRSKPVEKSHSKDFRILETASSCFLLACYLYIL
jgi:hypothetical protein